MSSTADPCRIPFRLIPARKDYLWGGQRLVTDFGKKADGDVLAESWECSTHPAGTSAAADGPFAGKDLRSILRAHPEMLGTHPRSGDDIPILVKFIDARLDLSVQVHPDDAYAARMENGQSGKAEMWYILDAEDGASIVYGFHHAVTKEDVRDSIADGSIVHLLQRIPVQAGDVFYIRPGTVHAILAGALVAEIQENSDLTYRLYDYGRRDRDGNLRPLHIDRALDVADLKEAPAPRQPLRVLRYRRGCAEELLVRCRYFQTERVLINTADGDGVPYRTGGNSFQVLLCIGGSGGLSGGSADGDGAFAVPFEKGTCIFVPAGIPGMVLRGSCELLRVTC